MAASWSPGTSATPKAIREGMESCDAVIHAAAMYEVGIPASQRPAMREANVGGTERVLRAVLEAKVPKVVYVSTVGAFGNTHGKVVDESYEHPGREFTSCYEETKWKAHQIAKRMIRDEGLSCVIVQPGGVYGPGDTSSIAELLNQFLSGKMPLIPFPELGICLSHVEDIAAGIVLALDKGKPGETYVLSGPVTTVREAIGVVAERDRAQGAEARCSDPADEGDGPDRAAGRKDDGPAAEPARADLLRRRRHLLGEPREGQPRARLRAPRPRAGLARNPRGGGQAARRRGRLIAGTAAMRVIDVHHLGRPHVIGCWEVDGVLIDPGPESSIGTLLEALGESSRRGRCCSPTSTSTMPRRRAPWCAAGPTSRSTSTSAAPRI